MGSVAIFEPKRKSEDKVVIAHISDLHFTASTNRQDRVWRALVEDLNQIPLDLLAVTGDVIDGSVADRGKDDVEKAFSNAKSYLLDDLCKPLGVDPLTSLLVIPGNHDFRLEGLVWKEPQYREFYRQFGTYFTSRIYSELGIALFVFDSNAIDRSVKLAINFATGLVKEEALIDHAALAADIGKNQPELWRSLTRVVLVHHHPMPIAPTEHRAKQLLPIGATELMLLKNAGLFMEQMVKTKMDLVLHGHRHYPAYSRAGFPVAEGGEHPLAVIAAGSVGKTDDHPFSYNRITIFPTGEVNLERRDLKAATYEPGAPAVSIRSYGEARRIRFSRLAAAFGKIQAKKYVRFETIKEGSGDSVIEEVVYEARALGHDVFSIDRILTSASGFFGPWTYEAPEGQKIDWKWLDPPIKSTRKGLTLFDPPLGRDPITFTRRGTTFNAIHFNQRDRLDATDQQSAEEHVTMQSRHAYDEFLVQVRFPAVAFPSGFRLQVTDENDRRDYKEEELARPGLTQFAALRTVLLRVAHPLPRYHYRIVWDLPKDDREELNLSALEAGMAANLIKALLELREPAKSAKADAVRESLLSLKTEVLSAETYASPAGDDQLEIALFVYDQGAHGLVCAVSTRGPLPEGLAKWVIKPGRTVAGQAFRRRAPLLFVNVPGIRCEELPYYEGEPEGLRGHTVIFAVPLFYPIRQGRKIAVLSLQSTSTTSGLLCLHEDTAATLALKDQAVVWYAKKLSPTLGVPQGLDIPDWEG
ncbi:MAG TPA: metallophosphoesterase [Terriglobia bacterium]|nr:metallophosphoesterase [Terriglobia bacterium]